MAKLRHLAFFVFGMLPSLTAADDSPQQQDVDAPDPVRKIKFDLAEIRDDGLRGPPDGLTSVSYEFCVPANEKIYAEIRKIDRTVQIHPGSRGRIGCLKTEALCIGATHQKDWRKALETLAALNYVKEIRECFFE